MDGSRIGNTERARQHQTSDGALNTSNKDVAGNLVRQSSGGEVNKGLKMDLAGWIANKSPAGNPSERDSAIKDVQNQIANSPVDDDTKDKALAALDAAAAQVGDARVGSGGGGNRPMHRADGEQGGEGMQTDRLRGAEGMQGGDGAMHTVRMSGGGTGDMALDATGKAITAKTGDHLKKFADFQPHGGKKEGGFDPGTF